MDVSKIYIEIIGCHVIYRFFRSSLGKVYNCARFPGQMILLMDVSKI